MSTDFPGSVEWTIRISVRNLKLKSSKFSTLLICEWPYGRMCKHLNSNFECWQAPDLQQTLWSLLWPKFCAKKSAFKVSRKVIFLKLHFRIFVLAFSESRGTIRKKTMTADTFVAILKGASRIIGILESYYGWRWKSKKWKTVNYKL